MFVVYKLSPSDFAYLYEECKLCYYLKIKHGITQPSKPMPGVFGAINTRLQGALVGRDLHELSSELPAGIVESQEGFVESKPIPGTNVFIKGKYDLLVRQPDGTYLVVDLKITNPDEEKRTKYQTQLQAYHYAFEHPVKGEPKNVTKLGLVLMYPDTVKFEDGKAHLDFPPHWMEVDIQKESFLAFMTKVNALLEGPPPPENPDCPWCKYRHMGEAIGHLNPTDEF